MINKDMSEKIIKYSLEKHISAAEAVKISGYHQDYIGQLCRGGKIECIKAGRDWLVDIDELLAYKKSQALLKKLNPFSDSWDKELLGLEEKNLEEKGKFVFPNLEKILVPIASVLTASVLIFGYYAYADEIEEALADIQHSVFDTMTEISLPEIKVNLPKIELPEISNTVSGVGAVVKTAGNIFSKTAKSIFTETKNGFAMFPQNLKELVQELFPSPEQKIIVQKTSAPQPASQNEIEQLKNELSQLKAKGLIIESPIVQKTIVEKTIERIISGLSSEELDAKLQTLNNKLMAEVINLKNQLSYRTDSPYNATLASTYQAVALTNKIDNLSGVTINNSTISGTLAGLTDAMIPDIITASNYLPLTGGTISGAITIPYLTATSTTATSTFPYLSATQSDVGTVVGGTWQGTKIDISDYTNLATTFPVTLTGDTVGIAYGTTTANIWSALQQFSNASTTQLSAYKAYFGGTATSTFDNTGALTLISPLAAGSGGTGISNPTAAGVFLGSYAGGTWQQIATSSLGLLTTDVAEGTNLYYTDARVNSYIHASTTIPKLYTANTFTSPQSFNYSSSTAYSSFATASTTNLIVNGSSFNNLLGAGLQNAGGVLTLNATGDWTGTLDGIEGADFVVNADINTIAELNAILTGEDVASTTWSGASSIVTLGTITTGTWNATDIDISEYTNLSITATGLQLSADAIALTSGYNIPLSASTTNWNTFYDTPSNRITDGTGLTWSSNTLNCDTASGSVQGCLTSTDWTTFNNKQATISATWPITLTGATVGFNGLSTSTAAVTGNIPYFSGVNTFANVATSSKTCTSPLSCAGFDVVGSGSGAITLSTAGDWTGTFDGQEGTYYLNAVNLTNFGAPFYTFFSATTTSALTEGTNLYYTDARARAAVSSSATGLTYTSGTGVFSLTSDYLIPTTAMQTSWNNKWDLASTTIGTIYGGTGTSTAPSYGQMLVGTSAGVYQLQATSTLGITQDLSGYLLGSNYYSTTTHANISSLPSLSITGSQVSNLNTLWDIRFAATSTTGLAEGTNKYYTDALARASLSSTATGLTYTSATGVLSLTSDYLIPTTAMQTTWNNKWDLASTTIGVAYGGTGLTSATAGYTLIGNSASALQATSTLFVSTAGNVGIGTTSPAYALDVFGSIQASNQLRTTIPVGTAPLAVISTTKVANLNADLLDGFDSSAFGDATLANQTTILSRIGTNADATTTPSAASSLWAGMKWIGDNLSKNVTMASAETAATYTHANAAKYCYDLSAAAAVAMNGDITTTYADWRLPTIGEAAVFEGTITSANYIWTATVYEASSGYWITLRLSDGNWTSYYYNLIYYVRCVR